jgi:hypothetical protein
MLIETIDPRASFSAVIPCLQTAWDSVSLGALKVCPRYYKLTIVEGWRGKGTNIHLRFGQLYHRALEVYDHKMAEGLHHEEALIEALIDLAEGCQDEVIDEDGVVTRVWWNPEENLSEFAAKRNTKTIYSLFRTVVWYLDQFGWLDPAKTVILANGKPAVELSFRYELGYTFSSGEPCLHSGHIDRLVDFNSMIYVMDRKTTQSTISGSSSWSYFEKYSPDNQMTGYTFASRVALAVPAVGVIIDAAQIAKGFSNFERGFTMRTDAQLEEWRADTLWWIARAEEFALAGHWPMNDTACDRFGGCPMRGICSKDPKVRHVYLSSDFKKEPWDPLAIRGDI